MSFSSKIFSNKAQLNRIVDILTGYMKLSLSDDVIPGSFMEKVVATIHDGAVLKTYEFIDVVNRKNGVAWQVKSTKKNTPLTWKRVKIRGAASLIDKSKHEVHGLQQLGNLIIEHCNDHCIESMTKYNLREVGYARLIVEKTELIYFERVLCTKKNPMLFDRTKFRWEWSDPYKSTKKEYLPALHGMHVDSGEKWFAWFGQGENQLHFHGESVWRTDPNTSILTFPTPSLYLDIAQQMKLLENLK